MARRWARGAASNPRVLGVVTAAVLITALLITSRSLNSGGARAPSAPSAGSRPANSQAPYRISGKVQCPPDWPVLAMSNHTSYPAGHPAKPPATAVPVACYQTATTAARAGYRPAPLPSRLDIQSSLVTGPWGVLALALRSQKSASRSFIRMDSRQE